MWGQANNRQALALGMALSGLLLVLLIRTAWQADDAYAAWRLVDNFVNGHGLRYNIDERVQTFTSMLWTMLVAGAYYIFRDIYYVSIFLAIALTLAAVWMVARPYRDRPHMVVFAYLAFGLSVAFMDFSAAGFENPLSHLLLASFAAVFFFADLKLKTNYLALFCIAGLAAINRLDTLAYYALPLAYAFATSAQSRRIRCLGVLATIGPIIAWHGFTLFYFGFPFQNAAYAKRFNNIALSDYLKAGRDYYLNSLWRDPLTLPTILLGMTLGLGSGDVKLRLFAAGIVIYLGWVLVIGGDFMSGRFFTLALLASVICILRSDVVSGVVSAGCGCALLLVMGSLAPVPTYLNSKTFGLERDRFWTQEWHQRGVADDRASWYQNSGLLLASRFGPMPRETPKFEFHKNFSHLDQQFPDSLCAAMVVPTGYVGFFSPRTCHIYDSNGQVDPLMARLYHRLKPDWRIGHFMKPQVPGYRETLLSGENRIVDPDLALYYEKLRLITRGDLWSWVRLKTILAMNIGRYDHLLRAYADRQAS